jgi:hypothetical protein
MSLPVTTLVKEPFSSKNSLFLNKSLGSSIVELNSEVIESEFA